MQNLERKCVMKHTISVISPVYNVKPYLERFIYSIKNQTCLDGVEVILVDDASTGGTFEEPALLHLIQQTEQIRVIHNTVNLGISGTRNAGILAATGEYLLFIDPDDYLESQLFEEIFRCLNSHPETIDIIRYHMRVENDYPSKDPYRFYAPKAETLLSGEQAVMKWCSIPEKLWALATLYVVRKNLLFENDMLFPDIRIHEDFAFVPALVLSARHVAVMDYVGYVYVKRHNSLSKAQSLDGIKREIAAFFRAYDIVIDRIRKLDVSDTIKGMVIQDCFHRLEKKVQKQDPQILQGFASLLEEKRQELSGWVY